MEEVLITGATGLVGRGLVAALEAKGTGIRSLSRSARPGSSGSGSHKKFAWDGVDPGLDALAGCTAVVHLAGEPVFGGLPTADRRRRIRESRIDSTRAIVGRLAELSPDERPGVFVCASAVGYYGDRGEESLDETAEPGSGFLAEVCKDWEAEAQRAEELGLRVVRVRIGVVLSKEGGALPMMRIPFSLGLGGRLGSGQQFFPWIHLDDLVGVFVWALEEPSVSGAVNGVAPQAVRNHELTKSLASTLHRPAVIPVPAFAMKLALGEMAGELLGSRNVQPVRLVKAAFPYRYPDLDSALEAELG
jgi:uncharacterized protein (TIGR01777 family)